MLRRALVQVAVMLLPWPVRRRILNALLGYEIHPDARLGFSIVVPYETLRMAPGSWIGHLNLVRGMDAVELGEGAGIGQLNWIYAIPPHATQLAHDTDRRAAIVLEAGAAITRRHLIDCSALVRLEERALVAGYGTQVLTHAVDMRTGRHGARPVTVGRTSMVGSRCILLGGAALPPCSALGAGSTLRTHFEEPYRVYSGVPAEPAGTIPAEGAFFSRADGYIS